ncbi:hypothetical protein [Bradyrhizobium sp. 62]|uniref:hypothetical protein n=1 Tax=Bradyrhizobium sp. 62 TaxID=1043588 RepID=UPI001FFB4321|nr:hypothetical protein [Bradyrhizobium sp. 62]MCK1367635.1 hypothetical protein [Bradyrhizobium sp. 62]
MIVLTDEEKKCGWTIEKLRAYQRERDKADDFVPGNVVTEFKRGKPAVVVEGPRGYSPFTRSVR